MNQDLQKFIELLKTDDALQEKMKSAAEKYEGEQTAEVVFQDLLLPIAEETGCHFTWEDYQEYVTQGTKELDPDEMDRVAGGIGAGLGACVSKGIATEAL